MKRTHFYLYFIAFFLCSCGIEEFRFSKVSPDFDFDNHPDSVKINHTFSLNLSINDDNKTVYLVPKFNTNECLFSVDGSEIAPGNELLFKNGVLDIVPISTGNIAYTLVFDDIYGNHQIKDYEFICFENLPPVADLKIKEIGQLSDFEVIIDATGSYDSDSGYDGKVVKYRYQIDDWFHLTTDKASIKYILPQEGTYTVSLQVLDNDGAWSDPVFQDVNM